MGTFNSFRLSVCEVKVGFNMVRYASMLSPLGFQTKAEGLDCVLGTEWVAALTSLTPSWALLQYGDGTTQKTPSECVKNVKRFSASPWLYGFSKSFRNWILESGACLGPLLGCGSKSGIFETWLTCSQRQTGMFDHVNSWLQSASLGSDWESSAGQSLCSEGEQHTVSRENCPSQVRRNPSFNKKCSCWDNDKSMFGGLLQIAALETLQRVVNLTFNNFDAHRPHTSPHHNVSCTSILLDQFHLIWRDQTTKHYSRKFNNVVSYKKHSWSFVAWFQLSQELCIWR